MALYLFENNANTYIAKENNDTNLMMKVQHEHLNMVTYPVSELSYD